MQIILARLEDATMVVRARRTDLGEAPILAPCKVAVALTWLLDGTKADLAKAYAYAEREGFAVYAFPVTEPDPLARARRNIARGT